jgi:hypothetical protein
VSLTILTSDVYLSLGLADKSRAECGEGEKEEGSCRDIVEVSDLVFVEGRSRLRNRETPYAAAERVCAAVGLNTSQSSREEFAFISQSLVEQGSS